MIFLSRIWNFRTAFLTSWRPITCILVIIGRNSRNKFKDNYLQSRQQFLPGLLDFQNLHQILSILKKNHLHVFNMSKVIHTKKCGYLNALNLMFQNILSANQCFKGSKTLLKYGHQHFYANVPLISNKLSFVGCVLVWYKI